MESVQVSILLLLLLHWLQDGLRVAEAQSLEPSFDVPMVNVTVREGITAVLPCSVKSLGQHQVVWTDQWSTLLTYEDRRIIDDERISVERPYTKDWNLHIRNVRYSDQGIFNCQINTHPIKIKTVNLKVQVPAKIISHLSSADVTAREGETVTLVCNVTGIPTPTVTWFRHRSKEDGEVENESEFCPGTTKIGVSGEVLIIHNISRYCGDIYECQASNNVPPDVSKQIKVSVEYYTPKTTSTTTTTVSLLVPSLTPRGSDVTYERPQDRDTPWPLQPPSHTRTLPPPFGGRDMGGDNRVPMHQRPIPPAGSSGKSLASSRSGVQHGPGVQVLVHLVLTLVAILLTSGTL